MKPIFQSQNSPLALVRIDSLWGIFNFNTYHEITPITYDAIEDLYDAIEDLYDPAHCYKARKGQEYMLLNNKGEIITE
jgi:hypothetical protein